MSDFKAKYEDMCRELNMDKATEERAFNMIDDISKNFSLEGNPAHWFCCALYTACRESVTPTVGEPGAVVMGNCVSLTKLLKCCELNIFEFFNKCLLWADMANLSRPFIHHIRRLKQSSHITLWLFKKYDEIFKYLFLSLSNEKKSTKFRSVTKCSSTKLYEFGWCLYLCAKNKNRNVTVDLVTSFHLLICCFDYIYVNILAENRVDLINPEFEGVPPKWNTPQFDVNEIKEQGIIEALCGREEAIPATAIKMKTDCWRPIIKEFFDIKTLNGDPNTYLGVVSNQYFDTNLKKLNSLYEQYVLSAGEFDETILLKNPNHCTLSGSDCEEIGKAVQEQHIRSLYPQTPYTGIDFLPVKDQISEPLAYATKSVKQLQEKLRNVQPIELLNRLVATGPTTFIKLNKIIESMTSKFKSNYIDNAETAVERLNLANKMYYYLLEKVIQAEMRNKSNDKVLEVLEREIPNITLFACSVEIVLDVYNLTNEKYKFPWVLRCFGISAFEFYKIIEPVVKYHDGLLTRPSIKHLNYVEETCLESLTWTQTSPIWGITESYANLPTWTEVDPNNMSKPFRRLNDVGDMKLQRDSAKRDLFNSGPANGSRKASSLHLFLRKLFTLAYVRLTELCKAQNMEKDCVDKIWTFLEYSITNKVELLRNRHLDQILMCAIYLYTKVEGIQSNETFREILKNYRKQPQASSDTYRNVFMWWEETGDLVESTKPVYDDLIRFYNVIYVKTMKEFAEKFNNNNKSEHKVPLSPHPPEKQNLPQKVPGSNNIYVHTIEKRDIPNSTSRALCFEIGKSPGKDLQIMNRATSGGSARKRQNDYTSTEEMNKKLRGAASQEF